MRRSSASSGSTLERKPDLVARAREEFRGKVLGCWCKPEACHGDVLIELIEGEPE
jgi:hypothetical protein